MEAQSCTLFVALGCALAALPGAGAGALECNVEDHGTVAVEEGLSTGAFQAALDRCGKAGGGTVRVPAGRYRIGSIALRSGVTLRLDAGARIEASQEPADYPIVQTRWEGIEREGHAALISARDVRDIAIVGEGEIDGRGAPWWERADAGLQPVPRPRLVELRNVQGGRVEGVTLRDSPSWTLHLLYSEDLDVRGVTIEAPPDSPNTDGIDVDSSRRVRISDCRIDVGDDGIAIKSGRDEDGRRVGRPSEQIRIERCTVLHGHGGVVIGSETAGSIRDVTVRDMVFEGTARGLRIKSRRGRGGTIERVDVKNVSMRGVAEPLVVNLRYAGDGGKSPDRPVAAEATPHVRDIAIAELKALGAERAGRLRGLPEAPLEGIRLTGIEIVAREGLELQHARDVQLDGIRLAVQDDYSLRAHEVERLEIRGLVGLGADPGRPWLELASVRGARLLGLAPPAGVPTLLVLEGAGTEGIEVEGLPPREPGDWLRLDDGAHASALRTSQEGVQ